MQASHLRSAAERTRASCARSACPPPASPQLIAINVEDPLATLLNDIDDVFVHMPGAVEALHHWLRHYKTPVLNEFGYDGVPQNRAFSEALIEETHEAWEKLIVERGSAATVAKV